MTPFPDNPVIYDYKDTTRVVKFPCGSEMAGENGTGLKNNIL